MADFKKGNGKDSNKGSKADAWINLSFVPKTVLEDESLSEEEVLASGLIPSGRVGSPVYKDDVKGGAVVFEKIIKARYEEIRAYLEEDKDNSMDDEECPKLVFLKEVAIRVYSAQLAEEILGITTDAKKDVEI